MNFMQNLLGTKTVNIAIDDDSSLRSQRSTYYSTTYTLTKPEVVTHIRVLEPHEDSSSAVAAALENITSMLCKSAAERLSSGECPTTESVIEIVCVKSGVGRLSTEQLRQDRHIFMHKVNSLTAISRDVKSQNLNPVEISPRKRQMSDEILQAPKKLSLSTSSQQMQQSARICSTLANTQQYSMPVFKEEIPYNDDDVNCSPHLDDLRVSGDILEIGFSDDSEESGNKSSLVMQNIDEKPPYTYVDLIRLAINDSPSKQMTLQEICKWIEDNFEYFRNHPNKTSWKDCVRVKLYSYNSFVRGSMHQSGCNYWTLDNSVSRPKNKYYSNSMAGTSSLPKQKKTAPSSYGSNDTASGCQSAYSMLDSGLNNSGASVNEPDSEVVPCISSGRSSASQFGRPEVEELLKLYRQYLPQFQDSSIRKRDIWNNIAQHFEQMGFMVDYEQCAQKWRNLEKRYREHCNAVVSGVEAVAPWYFDEMDALLRGPPGAVPSWDELAAVAQRQKAFDTYMSVSNASMLMGAGNGCGDVATVAYSNFPTSLSSSADIVTIDLESPDA